MSRVQFDFDMYDEDDDFKDIHNEIMKERIQQNSRQAKRYTKQDKRNKAFHLPREWSDKD